MIDFLTLSILCCTVLLSYSHERCGISAMAVFEQGRKHAGTYYREYVHTIAISYVPELHIIFFPYGQEMAAQLADSKLSEGGVNWQVFGSCNSISTTHCPHTIMFDTQSATLASFRTSSPNQTYRGQHGDDKFIGRRRAQACRHGWHGGRTE